jgi:hypothetical protein
MAITNSVVDSALDTLILSRTQTQKNRRLLSETRYRIARARRHLNPAFALTGGSDDERVRSIVRARLSTGGLWPLNRHAYFWAGYGHGEACVVCGSPIGGAELEYEAEGPGGLAAAHLTCFMIWHRESDQLAATESR